MLEYTQNLRPSNCDPALGVKEPCPHCGQFHLRPGYCQALGKGPRLVADETDDETLSQDETLNECVVCAKRFTPSRSTARYCSSACRLKAYRERKADA